MWTTDDDDVGLELAQPGILDVGLGDPLPHFRHVPMDLWNVWRHLGNVALPVLVASVGAEEARLQRVPAPSGHRFGPRLARDPGGEQSNRWRQSPVETLGGTRGGARSDEPFRDCVLPAPLAALSPAPEKGPGGQGVAKALVEVGLRNPGHHGLHPRAAAGNRPAAGSLLRAPAFWSFGGLLE